MASIRQFIKEHAEVSLLQARVESQLLKKLRTRLKKEKTSVKEFTEAAIQAYLAER